MTSQLLGVSIAAAAGGDNKDQAVAGWVAQQATIYNALEHHEVEAMIKEARECTSTQTCAQIREKFAALNNANDKKLAAACEANPLSCYTDNQDFVRNYSKTHELLSLASLDNAIPEDIKLVLGTAQLFNALALQKILAGGISCGVAQSASDTAGDFGVKVEPEAVGGFSKWAAALFTLEKGVFGTKATGTARESLVSKGSEVTPEVIQKALQGDTAISAQGAVPLPAVQRYVDRLLSGDVAPAIKMDGNVIVDGNHRYIAAKILGKYPDVIPWVLPPKKVGQTKSVSELKVDWGDK